jgi:DNA repair protein RadD
MHSYQSAETLRNIRNQLRRDELDVLVQVQILGEGADYPSFSVAAIFRPFRHLVPYLQFIGRVTRVLVEGAAGHPDNRGYVVSHPGLNVDRWWDALREFDEAGHPDEVPKSAARKGSIAPRESHGDFLLPGDYQPELQVLSEQGGRIVEQSFLPSLTPKLIHELDEVLERYGTSWQALGLEPSRTSALSSPAQESSGLDWEERPVSPQRRRQEARRRLNERVRSAASRLLLRLGLRVDGRELQSMAPKRPSANNLAAAIIVLNREVKVLLGVSSGTRSALPCEALQRVHDSIDGVIESAGRKLESFLALQRSG